MKESTLTRKGKPISKHLFYHVFSVERSYEPRSVWKILGFCGDTPWVWTWILDFGGKIPSFLLVGPKAVWPSNCLKNHSIAVFLLLTGLYLVYPSEFLKDVGRSQPLDMGPFAVESHFDLVMTVWLPALSEPLPQPASSWAVMVWPRNVFTRLRKCWRHTALTLAVGSSGQAWRSHVLETRQFLPDRSLKAHSLLNPFLPQRKIAFPTFCVLKDSHCLKAFVWRSLFSHNFPETKTLGKPPPLTGKGKPISKCLFHHVSSVGEIQWA